MKLYNFNMGSNGHHLEFALVRLRNIIRDFEEKGEKERAQKWYECYCRLEDAMPTGAGLVPVPWETHTLLTKAVDWAKIQRLASYGV